MDKQILTVDDMVRREVIYCVSTLIDELGKVTDLAHLDELYDLRASPPDYEEAARGKGYSVKTSDAGFRWTRIDDGEPCYGEKSFETEAEAWEDCCFYNDIKPYEWEIYEHWIVSSWLGERLAEQGERVVEFMGMTIWGRTCTGQAISMDSVMQRIHAELIDGSRVARLMDAFIGS